MLLAVLFKNPLGSSERFPVEPLNVKCPSVHAVLISENKANFFAL